MADTWITDIRHYLDEDGELAPMPAQARNLARYFGSIIEAMTRPPLEPGRMTGVSCRRRPEKKPCTGEIIAAFEEESRYIIWECPACGDRGRIEGFEGTPWDRSEGKPRLRYIVGGGG